MESKSISQTLKENRPYVRAAGLFLAALVALLYIIHPLYLNLTEQFSSLSANIEKIKDAAEWEENSTSILAQNKSYKQRIKKVKLGASKERKLSSLYQTLKHCAKASGVEFQSLKPGKEKENKSSVVVPFEIYIKSGFAKLGRFLNALENSGSIVKLNTVDIEAPRLDKAGVEAKINMDFLTLK